MIQGPCDSAEFVFCIAAQVAPAEAISPCPTRQLGQAIAREMQNSEKLKASKICRLMGF